MELLGPYQSSLRVEATLGPYQARECAVSGEISDRLEQMRAARQWDRVNPDNDPCSGCSRRERPDRLVRGFCAECRDTLVFLMTGCRFGRRPCCGSMDCVLPLDPDEAPLAAVYEADPEGFAWVLSG